MLTKDYVITKLSEDYAKEICSWRYEGKYSIYNFSGWDTVVENRCSTNWLSG